MVELLVTTAVAGVTLASAAHFFAVHSRYLKGHSYRLEAQQALRAGLDAIARDVRLGGACLPIDGQFVALDGADGPGSDTITVRTGIVGPNQACVLSGLTAAVGAGASAVTVADASGFEGGMLAYVRHPNGSGEFHIVTGVAGATIDLAAGLSQAYPAGSGVYAIDERTYALDTSSPAMPLLLLTVNRGAPIEFAAGVSDLQFEYVLDRNCPACDVVPLPADPAEWRLVNEIQMAATAQMTGTVRPQDEATFSLAARGKPRNLLP
jgi:hypothetical protein